MIHGSQLIAASRAAGEVLAIVTAGLKIGECHLRLNRVDSVAEFVFRAKVGKDMRGAECVISFEELCLQIGGGLEGLAHLALMKFDRIARSGR